MWSYHPFGRSAAKVGSNLFANILANQMHVARLLHSQYSNNGGKTNAPPAETASVICTLNGQQHCGYIESGGAIWDCWYESSAGWQKQKINLAAAVTSGPNGRTSEAVIDQSTSHPVCIWVDPSGSQQHFTYRSTDKQLNGPVGSRRLSKAALESRNVDLHDTRSVTGNE